MESIEKIIEMEPIPFMEYMQKYTYSVDCNVESIEAMNKAGVELGQMSNIYSFLSTLYSYANIRKRQLARENLTQEYQDMIDKANLIERLMHSVDMQYKAISKAITIHIENNRELYYTDGIRRKSY